MSILKSYAIMKGGRIYTLNKLTHRPGEYRLKEFKWRGYCDGQPCGFFKTKKDFEDFVSREKEVITGSTEQSRASMMAETWSTFEGHQMLQKFLDSKPIN